MPGGDKRKYNIVPGAAEGLPPWADPRPLKMDIALPSEVEQDIEMILESINKVQEPIVVTDSWQCIRQERWIKLWAATPAGEQAIVKPIVRGLKNFLGKLYRDYGMDHIESFVCSGQDVYFCYRVYHDQSIEEWSPPE